MYLVEPNAMFLNSWHLLENYMYLFEKLLSTENLTTLGLWYIMKSQML